ncbi:MAG: hypothetical protein EOO22_02260 [Comamonadaceae bacterium]|nr:MAG: hypothetical protein EOO22_02260 [Comamonadaceae bacterium]
MARILEKILQPGRVAMDAIGRAQVVILDGLAVQHTHLDQFGLALALCAHAVDLCTPAQAERYQEHGKEHVEVAHPLLPMPQCHAPTRI